MVSFEVITVTDGKWTPIIGSYLPTSTLEHLPELEEALIRFRYHDPILLGDLKADIHQAENPCIQQVADLLMEFGMMNRLLNFQQHWWLRHLKTWYHVRQGRAMREIRVYIMGTDRRRFEMAVIRGARNYP